MSIFGVVQLAGGSVGVHHLGLGEAEVVGLVALVVAVYLRVDILVEHLVEDLV